MRSTLTSRTRGSRLQDPGQDHNPFIKMSNTNTSSFNFLDQQSEIKKYKTMVSDLQGMLKEQKQKNQQLKQKMQMLARRTVIRERQFHNILQKTNKSINNYNKQMQLPLQVQLQAGQIPKTQTEQVLLQKTHQKIQSQNKMNISKTYAKILSNFENSNKASNEYIQKRYSQGLKSMDNKISAVLQIFDQQVLKMKKITNINKTALQKSIHQILSTAKLIQQQNNFLRVNYADQKTKCKLLQEQKQLLILQMVNKKKIILRLYSENKRYRQRYQKNQLDASPVQQLNQLANTQILTKSKIRTVNSKQLNQNYHQVQMQIIQQLSSTSRTKVNKNNEFITQWNQNNRKGKYNQRFAKSKSSRKNSPSRIASRSVHLPQKQKVQKQGECQCLKKNQQSQKRIIDHLKKSLQRQKKKNNQLNRILIKIQNQNEQINNALFQVINQIRFSKSRYQDNNPQKSLQLLIKSEKLFQTIKNLKQRLSMTQRPSVSCGWGQLGLDKYYNLQKVSRQQIK